MPVIIYLFLAILSFIWGGSFYFIKILLDAFGPLGVTFIRCLCGAIILLLIILFKKDQIQFKGIPWVLMSLIGLINCAIPWTLIAFSETVLSSSLTSVLNAFTPIWTVILGILFFRSKSNVFQWIGVLMGLIGILLLINMDWKTFQIDEPLGVGAMLLTTLSYGFGAHLSKKYLQAYSVYLIACVTLAGSAAFSGIGMLITEQTHWSLLMEPQIYTAVMGLGVFGSGIAYILFYTILQRGSAEFVVLVTYLVPPFAIFWGYFLLNESIYWSLVIGMVCIFAGVYLAGKNPRSR